MASTVMSTGMVSARGGSAAVHVATRAKAAAMVAFVGGASVQSVGGGRRAVMGRRGGREQQRSLVVRAADEEEEQQPMSQTRKRVSWRPHTHAHTKENPNALSRAHRAPPSRKLNASALHR